MLVRLSFPVNVHFSVSQPVVYQPGEKQCNYLPRCDLLHYYSLSLTVLHLIGSNRMQFLLFSPYSLLLKAAADGACTSYMTTSVMPWIQPP